MRYLVNVVAYIFWLMDIMNLPFMYIFDTDYPLNGLFWFITFLMMSILYETERVTIYGEKKNV